MKTIKYLNKIVCKYRVDSNQSQFVVSKQVLAKQLNFSVYSVRFDLFQIFFSTYGNNYQNRWNQLMHTQPYILHGCNFVYAWCRGNGSAGSG